MTYPSNSFHCLLLAEAASLALLISFMRPALPALGPLQLLFPLQATLLPTHLHLANTSHPPDLCFSVTSSETSPPFPKISFTLFSASALCFSSRVRNEVFMRLLTRLLYLSLIIVALGGQVCVDFSYHSTSRTY